MPTSKGKPCGASHIPKQHKCRKGVGAGAGSTNSSGSSKAVIGAAAAAGVAVAILARKRWTRQNDIELAQAQRYNTPWDTYERKLAADARSPEVARLRQQRSRDRRALCAGRADAQENENRSRPWELRADAYKDCGLQIGESSAYGKVILHPSQNYVMKIPTGNSNYSISQAKAKRAANNEAVNLEFAFDKGVAVPELLSYNPNTGVIKMQYLKDYRTLREVAGGELRSDIKNWPTSVRQKARMNLFRSAFKMHSNLQGHADLHMGNIMMNADGDIRFIDFGIARSYRGNPDPAGYVAAIHRDLPGVTRNIAHLVNLDMAGAQSMSRWLQFRHKTMFNQMELMWMRKTPADNDQIRKWLDKYYIDMNRVANYMETNRMTSIPVGYILT